MISGNTVQSLPLNGRNTGQLALLLPGTMTYNPRGFTNIGSMNMNRPFVNGNREQTNNFTVDGLDVNETIDNRVAYQPVPDALAEISVETNNYARRVGNVGGASINSVIKSGRESVPRQRIRVLPEQRLRREHVGEQPVQRGQTGAHSSTFTAGRSAALSCRTECSSSPTTRDRGRMRRAPATASVAPEAWRRGDLSSISAPIIDPQTRSPSRQHQIPVERFSPTARALLNDLVNYPLPNRTVSGGINGNFVGPTLLAIRAHQGDARVDWSIGQNDKFFGRYSFAKYEDRRDEQPFPLVLTTRNDQPFYNIGFNWNRIIGRQ